MKNKLFLSLSLLTMAFTGLDIVAKSKPVAAKATVATSQFTAAKALAAARKLSPTTQFGILAAGTGVAGLTTCGALNQAIGSDTFATMKTWIPLSREGYVVEAPVVVIPTPTKFEQFKTMLNNAGTSTLNMVNTNTATKVATGAAVAAVTGLVAYKSYKALVGQAVKDEPVTKTVKARRSTSSTPAPVTKKTVKRFNRRK